MAQAVEQEDMRRLTTLGDEPTAIGKYSNQSAFTASRMSDVYLGKYSAEA